MKGKKAYRKDDPEAGWSFMETIIVLAIVLILTATVGFVFIRYVGKAKVVAATTQIETFKLALAQYFMDVGDYPSEDQGLDALHNKPSSGDGLDKWDGPYLDKPVPLDPWGRAYAYSKPGPDGAEFGIACLGADGLEGGTGKNADILTWSTGEGE